MQARLAMILSVGGVLVAGTAAAVVNSEVLSQNAAPPVTAPLVSPAMSGQGEVDPTLPAPTAPPVETTAAPTTTAVSTVPVTSATTPPPTPAPSTSTTVPVASAGQVAGSTTQQTFRLGDAATAIVDTAGGVLTIVSVVPHPGWEVDRAEQQDPTSVEIRMRSSNGEVRFEASLVRGVVVVSLRTGGDGETSTDGASGDASNDDSSNDDDASDDDSSDDDDASDDDTGDDDSGSGGHGGDDD